MLQAWRGCPGVVWLTLAALALASLLPNGANAQPGFVASGESTCSATGEAAGVVAGARNNASGDFSFVGAGDDNWAAGNWSAVAGGDANTASGSHAVVVGGVANSAGGTGAFIGGGGQSSYNESNVSEAVILVAGNLASGDWSVVSGGQGNAGAAAYAAIGGGLWNSVAGSTSTIAGGMNNAVAAGVVHAVVAGGAHNIASGSRATVSGGWGNGAYGNGSSVGGGSLNVVNASHATVSGGFSNSVAGKGGAVGGGRNSTASGFYSVVGGGLKHDALGFFSTISGGRDNAASGVAATIGGGAGNIVTARADYGLISGGSVNSVNAPYATVAGGFLGFAGAFFSTVGGGFANSVDSHGGGVLAGGDNVASGDKWNVVSGGLENTVQGFSAAILGGEAGFVGASHSSIGGGEGNTVNAMWAVVAGGDRNDVSAVSDCSGVGSGSRNSIAAAYAWVGGGERNRVIGDHAVVGGGDENQANGDLAAVAGGSSNTADGFASAVGGGIRSMASAYAAVVAGGYHNTASTAQAVVGGGYVNVASGTSSTVSGGAWNVASGNGAAVVGGLRNKATGLRSLAAGQGAVASHAHSAVLGFNSTGDTCLSNGEGTVSICADAGLYLNGYRYNVTDDVHQNAADIAVLSDEVVALWTLGAALVQNDSALSTRVARVELDSADLLANATAMQLELAQCNAQVLAQTAQISQLSSTVIALNATVRTQDLTISSLEDRVDQLNANISSMSDALQMLLSAAAFTTVPVDCEYDGNLAVTGGAPCDSAPQSTAGHAFSTTSIAAQNDASTVPLPVSEAPSVVKPNVTARSTSHLTNGQTSLPPGSAATLELSTSVPPSSDATSTTTATATTATVTTTTTTTTTTIGPPTLHDMSIDFVSSTPVLTKFRVSVNATTEASGRMTYAYRLIQKTASSQLISYDVAFSYADTLLFEVPSTRDFFVEVSIRNDADSGASPMRTSCMMPGGAATTSGVNCPIAEASSYNDGTPTSDIVAALMEYNFTSNTSAGLIALLTGLDSLQSSGLNSSNATGFFIDLYNTFFNNIGSTADGTAAPVDQSVIVLSSFIAANNGSIAELAQDLLDGISAVASNLPAAAGGNGGTGSGSTLDLFVNTVDGYAGSTPLDIDAIATLDSAIDAVCVTGGASAGGAASYSPSTFALSCGNSSTIETESASVVVPGTASDQPSSVSITAWDPALLVPPSDDPNSTATSDSPTFLANVQGVSVASADGSSPEETEVAGDGFQISIQLSASESEEPLRRRVSCRYYSQTNGTWIERGVYLRGVAFGPRSSSSSSSSTSRSGVVAEAICVSTHLTLFTVTDESEAAKLVEAKVNILASRFEELGDVDLLDGDTRISFEIPLIFCLATGAFGFVAVIARARASRRSRRRSVEAEARELFIHEGKLSRPAVIRSIEHEAILRGWLRLDKIASLFSLDIVSGNPFLTLMFRWAHEHLVFTQVDKALGLYAGVLSTFLVQAFFFDASVAAEGTGNNASAADAPEDPGRAVRMAILNVFVGALFANLLLFPVKYFLPFMIANVNSFTTNTHMPKGIIRRQLDRLKARLCVADRRWRLGAKILPITADSTKAMQARRTRSRRVRKHQSSSSAVPVTEDSDTEKSFGNATTSDEQESTSSSEATRSSHDRLKRSLKFLWIQLRLLTSRDFQRGAWRSSQSTCCGGSSGGDLPHGSDNAGEPNIDDSSTQVHADHPHWVLSLIVKFQTRIRARQKARRRLREVEFSAWLHDCKGWRNQLSAINGVFLASLASFTLVVLLLLSASFTPTESLLWLQAVGQSLVMQLFVTDPLLSSVVLAVRLLFSFCLLRGDRRKRSALREARWEAQEAALDVREMQALDEMRRLARAFVRYARVGDKPGQMEAVKLLAAWSMFWSDDQIRSSSNAPSSSAARKVSSRNSSADTKSSDIVLDHREYVVEQREELAVGEIKPLAEVLTHQVDGGDSAAILQTLGQLSARAKLIEQLAASIREERAAIQHERDLAELGVDSSAEGGGLDDDGSDVEDESDPDEDEDDEDNTIQGGPAALAARRQARARRRRGRGRGRGRGGHRPGRGQPPILAPRRRARSSSEDLHNTPEAVLHKIPGRGERRTRSRSRSSSLSSTPKLRVRKQVSTSLAESLAAAAAAMAEEERDRIAGRSQASQVTKAEDLEHEPEAIHLVIPKMKLQHRKRGTYVQKVKLKKRRNRRAFIQAAAVALQLSNPKRKSANRP